MDEHSLGDGEVHPKTGQWEFGVGADFDFAELARTMRFVGAIMMVFGVVALIVAVLMLLDANDLEDVLKVALTVVEGIVMVVIGTWTRGAAESFYLITQTEGDDLHHLMTAVGGLRRIYGLQYVLLIIAVLVLVAALLALLVMAF